MKDQVMPKTIRGGLFNQDLPSDLPSTTKWDRLIVKNFDVRPHAIIYQSHSMPQGENHMMQSYEEPKELVKQTTRG
ncbi:hypothetical protein L484_026927 [Morus notabilis]|uniref:Uncharacterized protein n=1 Tax=Morus notabilis TaxID=981085 RepID=W9R974_9ROSA|nr:hypothetical protein L484_026927 [Morus notabilis]